MSEPEDKKIDLSQFPRGAIGIKGLPVNRNARLPSIRTPRDLTLGSQAKRTFTPNIPARREKRHTETEKASVSQPSTSDPRKNENKPSAKFEKEKGRRKEKAQVIQTEGSVFGEGIAASKKIKNKESGFSVTKSEMSSGRVPPVKREARDVDMRNMSQEMSKLLRDDFIDDGSEEGDEIEEMKPVIYPIQKSKNVLKEEKGIQPPDFNNKDFAKELGFDVKKISKFIKKEKTDEHSNKTAAKNVDIPKSQITDILTSDQTQFLLLQFPECIVPLDAKGQSQTDQIPSSDQKAHSSTLSSLPEGQIGKLQILKSGRARLVIGGLHYDLDCVNPLKTRHDIVSVDTNTDSGHITALGRVENKLCFAPDIEMILS